MFLIFINKFIKIILFISCNKIISIENIIYLYFYHYYNIFNLLIKFILNYDIYFISWFWRILMRFLNIQKGMIFIFHFNINDQTYRNRWFDLSYTYSISIFHHSQCTRFWFYQVYYIENLQLLQESIQNILQERIKISIISSRSFESSYFSKEKYQIDLWSYI